MGKRLLLLALSLTLLAGCNTTPSGTSTSGEPEPTGTTVAPTSTSEEKGDKAAHSAALKKAGDDVFDVMGAKRNASKSLDPLDDYDKIIYLSLPGVLLYMGGLLTEAGIDVESHVFDFGGDYEFKFGGGEWQTQNIFLGLKATIKESENKINLNANQRVSVNDVVMADSDLFIDVDFDFAKNETKGFELYMEQNDDYAYVKVVDGVGQIRKSTTTLSEDEEAALRSEYDARKAAFAIEKANKVSSTEANNRLCMEKFVQTQLYENELIGQDLPVRIKE